MKQLDLFDTYDKDQCSICGNPLSLTDIMDGKDICEDCEAGCDNPECLDIDDIPDNGEQ